MRKHLREQREELSERKAGKNGDENGDIAQKCDEGTYQAHLCALAHPEPIEQPEKKKYTDSHFQCKGDKGRHNHAQIQHTRKATDGSREEVIDQNEHTTEGSHPVINGLGSHWGH